MKKRTLIFAAVAIIGVLITLFSFYLEKKELISEYEEPEPEPEPEPEQEPEPEPEAEAPFEIEK